MKKLIILNLLGFVLSSCSQNLPDKNLNKEIDVMGKISKSNLADSHISDGMILVKGGKFINTQSNYYRTGVVLDDFYISRFEVSQKEWVEIMGKNPSEFKGENLPVETVSWYDCIDFCNRKSVKAGLNNYYNINKNKKDPKNLNNLDNVKWTVTINSGANGYRLPAEAEWEYAASGGQKSKNYSFSGGNNIDKVAWYWKNTGDKYLSGNWSWPALVQNKNKPKPIGTREPNELGLYDMSGNVREWCWNWMGSTAIEDLPGRIWKGGGWIGADFCCEIAFRADHEANGKGPDQGFRICRNN